MKKTIAVIIITMFLGALIPLRVLGLATVTPTPQNTIAPTKTVQSKQIDDFKEKLASQVAKLSEKNKKAVAGIVQSADEKKIKVKTDDEGEYEVKIDPELTKYFLITGATKAEKDITTIKKGVYVIVGGTLVDRVIDGNVIYQDEQFLVDSGKIVAINTTDNSFDIVTLAKENYTLDVETTTKMQLIDIKTLEPGRTSMSKIKEGDSIHFVEKKAQNIKNRFSELRILIVPQEYFIK